MQRCVMLFFVAIVFSLSRPIFGADAVPVGKKINGFKLQDFRGATHELASWKDRELIVVVFLGTECPLAKLYGPRLAELAQVYGPKNVEFVAIDANEQDTLAEMAHYARLSKIEFPFLKDPSNAVADQFGAERTPEVFVLDKERVVRYQGRIDDQFGIGTQRSAPQRKDLALALDELLARTAITVPATKAIGCHIGRVHRESPRGDINYAQHIAPLFQKHCVTCHRSGEIGPFALTSYEDVVNWSATIREVVSEHRMPPWHAKSDAGQFLNDRRLDPSDEKRLFDWIDNGMPMGNASEIPKGPQFTEGWEIPQPDLVLEMSQPYEVPATGTVEYQYFSIKQKFDEDKWVSAAEARPGNRSVVHHLILFYVPAKFEGRIQEASLTNSLATFAPGMPAWKAPAGIAKRIPAGARLYLQAHYTPNGVATTDLSRIGLVFFDPKLVQKQLKIDAAVNFRLRIPPQADDVQFNADFGFGRDVRLISLLPHMHLRGKAFRIESVKPDGARTLLLDVPRYDFNWQNNYVFAQPILMPEGSRLICTARYDNSDKNPANPDPTQTVGWGDQTWEEMLVAQIETVLAEQDLRLGMPQVRPVADGEYEAEFTYHPTTVAGAVYLAGTFNEWKPTGHKMEGPDQAGNYKTKIPLKPGVHEYKFVIDGKTWRADPGNPESMGVYGNSVLRIVAK